MKTDKQCELEGPVQVCEDYRKSVEAVNCEDIDLSLKQVELIVILISDVMLYFHVVLWTCK